jgi:hypothetical protein
MATAATAATAATTAAADSSEIDTIRSLKMSELVNSIRLLYMTTHDKKAKKEFNLQSELISTLQKLTKERKTKKEIEVHLSDENYWKNHRVNGMMDVTVGEFIDARKEAAETAKSRSSSLNASRASQASRASRASRGSRI